MAPIDSAVEKRVIEIVTGLVSELRDGQQVAVAPKESLERDLGISSLERVELIIRLEQAFGVQLGDTAMVGAETPADLAAAIAKSDAQPDSGHLEPLGIPSPAKSAETTSSAKADTLVEALAWHVKHHPDRIHIHLREEAGTTTPLSYQWLWDKSRAIAGGLAAHGLGRHDTVAIMLRTEQHFFPVFMGALMAGCVPVPLYPPFRADRIEEYAKRQIGILRNAEARLLITFKEVHRIASLLTKQVSSLKAVVAADALADTPTAPIRSSGDAPALIQYTSGSTGQPKGVLLSHGNLMANIRSIERRLMITSGDTAVSWLPLYHDMGLIGAWLGPLYTGVPVALMSPLTFLARPVRWLQALHTHRGTVSPAPNFAYDLCATRIKDAELDGLDLSSVRILLNGSETVSANTLNRFISRFEPYGLIPTAVLPVYGLAECSVGLATPTPHTAPRIDHVQRSYFQTSGRAVPSATNDMQALRFVSCGRPLPDHEIMVVDTNGNPVLDRLQGRIRFRGPSATRGYYRNSEATQALIGKDGWLETGDLGYISDGDLFLTGRSKDLIIKGGHNLYPHEAEAIAGTILGVRAGCVAAFGTLDEARGTEQFVIVVETRLTISIERDALRRKVIQEISTALGVAPDRVVLAPPGSVSKTSSGKIRRDATRSAWLQGRIGKKTGNVGQWIRLTARATWASLINFGSRLGRCLYTSYVVTLVLTTSVVTWTMVLVGPRGGWTDRIIGRWTRLVMELAGCPVKVLGSDRVQEGIPIVFVANHASYIDSPLLMGIIPIAVRFAAKARLAKYPGIGLAIRKGGHIPIHKSDQSQRIEGADDLYGVIKSGQSLFVFPEGTFAEAARLLPFRLGAFRAAVDNGCPIIPIAIRGTRYIWPADSWLLRPGRVTVTFGQPLRAASQDWSEIIRLRDSARQFISENIGET